MLFFGILFQCCNYKKVNGRQSYTVKVKHVYRGDLLGPLYYGKILCSERIAREVYRFLIRKNDPNVKKEPIPDA